MLPVTIYGERQWQRRWLSHPEKHQVAHFQWRTHESCRNETAREKGRGKLDKQKAWIASEQMLKSYRKWNTRMGDLCPSGSDPLVPMTYWPQGPGSWTMEIVFGTQDLVCLTFSVGLNVVIGERFEFCKELNDSKVVLVIKWMIKVSNYQLKK